MWCLTVVMIIIIIVERFSGFGKIITINLIKNVIEWIKNVNDAFCFCNLARQNNMESTYKIIDNDIGVDAKRSETMIFENSHTE